jgi:hypothetical protein
MAASRCIGAFALLAILSGCAQTNYVPVHSSRLTLTSEGFVRDGAKYSNLAEAVHGNQRAVSEAETGRSFLVGGIAGGIAGVVLEGFGLGTLAAGERHDEAGEPSNKVMVKAGAIMTLTGLTASVVSIILLGHAQAHQQDAMNIYNDGVGAADATSPSRNAPRPP